MKNKIYLILLFIIILLFFIPFFLNVDFLTTRDNDLGRQYVPLFSFFRNSVVSYHQLPLWEPGQMMGETFIGTPWSSVVYPFNLIYLIFPIKFAEVFYLFVHFLLAGIFMYFLAKDFKLSNISSFAAAIFYAFSTKMLLHLGAGHITMIAAFSFFPLFFLSIKKLLVKFDLIWEAIGAISAAFIYITYPTIFYYAGLFGGLYWFYHLGKKLISKNVFKFQVFKQDFFSYLVMFIIFFGLISIVFFPQLEFAPLSTRLSLKLEDVALPIWNVKRFLTSLIFPYFNLKSFDHEAFLYLGFIPSTLFIFGFLRLSKINKLFLGGVGFLTLLFVTGLSTPVFKIAYELLPFLKYSRITTRLWFAVALVVALVAAYAIEKIKSVKVIFVLLSIFIFESLFIFYLKFNDVPFLSFKNEGIYQYISHDRDLFRVYCTTYCFNPQLSSKYKINLFNGETPIQDASFVSFLQKAGGYNWKTFAVIFPPYQVWQTPNPPVPNSKLLGLGNVKYVASTYEISNPDFLAINKFGGVYLYRNLQFMERAYLVDSENKVKIEYFSPNNIKFSFPMTEKPSVLIISENFAPGWFASSGKTSLKIRKFNEVFRQVSVPEGVKSVELKYRPKSFLAGSFISGVTLLFLVSIFYFKRKRWLEF